MSGFRPLPDGSERNRDKHGEAWGYNEAAITYDDFRRAPHTEDR